jgi:hypothetical protein
MPQVRDAASTHKEGFHDFSVQTTLKYLIAFIIRVTFWSIWECVCQTGKRDIVTTSDTLFTNSIAQNTYSDREICAGKTPTIPEKGQH